MDEHAERARKSGTRNGVATSKRGSMHVAGSCQIIRYSLGSDGFTIKERAEIEMAMCY